MRTLTIDGEKTITGSFNVLPSEIDTIEYIILSSFINNKSIINNPSKSLEVKIVENALENYGIEFFEENNSLTIIGKEKFEVSKENINVGFSEITAGFIIPLSTLVDGKTYFNGKKEIILKIINQLMQILEVEKRYRKKESIEIEGPINKKQLIKLNEKINQYLISGIILSLLKNNKDIEIKISKELFRSSLLRFTLKTIEEAGIKININEEKNTLIIPSQQESFQSIEKTIDGSYFSSSIILSIASISHSLIRANSLKMESLQPEKAIIDLLKQHGAEVIIEKDFLEVDSRSSEFKPISFDSYEAPSLTPIAIALGCLSNKWSIIKNIDNAYVDKDWIKLLEIELRKIGVETYFDGKTIYLRAEKLAPAKLNAHEDYRIALVCLLIAYILQTKIEIIEANLFINNYSEILNILKNLGAEIYIS
jgi:3-phosphoshikimate 1-carboxyvinyltransferase